MKIWRWMLSALLILPAQALADRVHIFQEGRDSYWMGVTAAQINLEFDMDEDELKQQPVAAGVRIGALAWDYVGAELRLAAGVREGRDRTLEREDTLEHMISGFIVGHLPITRDISLRGYLGGSELQVRTETDAASGRNTQSDFAWGAGGLWRPVDELGLTLEYMHYSSKYNLDVESFEVGAMFFF